MKPFIWALVAVIFLAMVGTIGRYDKTLGMALAGSWIVFMLISSLFALRGLWRWFNKPPL